MLPVVGLKKLATSENKVVLPAPFGPTNPKMLWLGTSKLTSFNAKVAPNFFDTLWIEIELINLFSEKNACPKTKTRL